MSGRRFRLTDRDEELLVLLFCHRLVLARQLVELGHFGSLVRCNARLRRLRQEGFLAEAVVPSIKGTQAVHQITSRAAHTVAERLGLDASDVRRACSKGSSVLQLEHCVRTTDLRTSFEQGAAHVGLAAVWTPELLCRHEYSVRRYDGWQRRTLKPDGLLRLSKSGAPSYFFVETDLGNVSHRMFTAKVASYRQYAQGVFQETYGAQQFAVLVVTTGERRLTRLASIAMQGEVQTFLTTFAEVGQSGPFEDIWTLGRSGKKVSLLAAEGLS